MTTEIKRNSKILRREDTALLIIDVQKRILGVMQNHEELVKNIIKLIKGAEILGIKIYYTEQYPKGLGETIDELKNLLNKNEAVHKMTFSCSGAGDLFSELKKNNFSQIAVCGIESHVCVQQTVLDLIENDFQVTLTADACSSRRKTDYDFAMDRMRQHGAEVTTTECVLFELLQVCGTDEFRSISKLVK
ncbi:MAG: hydrolase [Ignavibacteriae bacterium]|nr:hydrolase [Ignavibacteriota bacterium]NOG97195.1 hydrolase [Ignavibacteriota bacterium]